MIQKPDDKDKDPMAFTTDNWAAIGHILHAIERHPFLKALSDGSLPMERFRYYMAQDTLFLTDYARMLALAASQATRGDEIEFWSESAAGALSEAKSLHTKYIDGMVGVQRSPTCTAYTSYLAMLGSNGSYPALVAGLLPCFWIYEHAARILKESSGNLAANPYADWLAYYTATDFTDPGRQAREIVDRATAELSAAERAQAAAAFRTASLYEWMFWDAAWRMEQWPL